MCFAVTGLDIWASLLSTGVICTLYTTVVSESWPLRGLVDDSRREAPSQLPVPLPDWTPRTSWAGALQVLLDPAAPRGFAWALWSLSCGL